MRRPGTRPHRLEDEIKQGVTFPGICPSPRVHESFVSRMVLYTLSADHRWFQEKVQEGRLGNTDPSLRKETALHFVRQR